MPANDACLNRNRESGVARFSLSMDGRDEVVAFDRASWEAVGPMNTFEKLRLARGLAASLLSWLRADTHRPTPVPENPRFMSAYDAAQLVRDGDVVADSGLGAHQRSSIVYQAIRESFQKTGHPARLTVMNLGGHGGRGRAPGTLEELGRAGLCARFVTGHFETFHAMLDLAGRGECELQCLPQGTMALLLAALGRGEESCLSETGIGTFVDPRVGPGSAVTGRGDPLVTLEGDRLRYRIPKIDVALFNAPAVDRHGNVYMKNAAMIGEAAEIARAAKRNGGRVIVNVGLIVEEGWDRIFLPASEIDAIVWDPSTEQTGAVPHRAPWRTIVPNGEGSIAEGLERARFLSRLLRITPRRRPIDEAVVRLATTALIGHIPRGAYVNIGTGMPEDVPRVVFEAGRLGDVTFVVESGPVGGVPAPGMYFGASLRPRELISSAEMFELCYRELGATCLGALQVDSDGNVNVSRRGSGPRQWVGPGGFIDLWTAAKTVVFVTAWMNRAQISVKNGRVVIERAGSPKFVERVDEITFSGPRALGMGKQVFYATPVGLFRLGPRGVELVAVMPGIDLARDVLGATQMRIVLPESGVVPVLPASIVSGAGFELPKEMGGV